MLRQSCRTAALLLLFGLGYWVHVMHSGGVEAFGELGNGIACVCTVDLGGPRSHSVLLYLFGLRPKFLYHDFPATASIAEILHLRDALALDHQT
jgi:hypothetical protein